ncbi:hypothetical protein P7F60_06270 [Rhizobium sp. YJ-22]|uniref:hypothetical protein n=1 Tax=Rhizobium sp. YJ-22 TaxID=3037556 RepID=UPI002412564C|nr:hypothetical protein [Rhizobium sp. YJ-22]MDG3575981.1 hypothetical protein [Rhizobium sp. YJ-22]
MAKPTRTAPVKIPEDMTLNGSNTLPAQIEIAEGKSVQLGEVVMLAFQKSGLQPEAWNDLPEADRDAALNLMIENMKVAAAGVGGDTADNKPQAGTTFVSADGQSVTITADLPSDRGPRARQEIRYRGKTYAPGEYLPADIDDTTLDELDDYDAI